LLGILDPTLHVYLLLHYDYIPWVCVMPSMSLQAQAPGGQCVGLTLQPSPAATEQPAAWLLTDETLHVLHPDSGCSARAVLSDAPLSGFVKEEPDARTQVSLQSARGVNLPPEGQDH